MNKFYRSKNIANRPVAVHIIEDDLESKVLQIKSRLKLLDEMEVLGSHN